MFDLSWIGDLDAAGTCAAVSAAQRQLVEQEATLLVSAAHWADLHNGDAIDSTGRVLPGMEQAKKLGGPGTPAVLEFAASEFGALQGITTTSAQNTMADALNLRHRHPLLWRLVNTGQVRKWKAVKVARAVHEASLTLEQARWLDEETTDFIDSLPWGRFEDLLNAKIIQADPAKADAKRQAAETERYVRLGRSNEHGMRTLIAQGRAGDVLAIVASANLIAEILAAFGDNDPIGARRTKALGILANPPRAEALLKEYAAYLEAQDGAADGADDPQGGPASGDETPNPEPDGDSDVDNADNSHAGEDTDAEEDTGGELDLIGEGDVHPADNDADDPGPAPCGSCGGCGVEPVMAGNPLAFVKHQLRIDRSTGGRSADAVRSLDWRRLMPRAVFYVHLSEETLHAEDGGGVARIEGIGPATMAQLREFLRDHTGSVTVKGVIDIPGQVPVDAYETPDRMREAMHLLRPGDMFPYGVNLSRRKDLDHPVPYLPPARGGPPGQTHLGNQAPLTRFHHRVKTHGRWRIRQDGPGVYLWRSPHGYYWQVGATGTHPLTRQAGEAYWHALAPPDASDLPRSEDAA